MHKCMIIQKLQTLFTGDKMYKVEITGVDTYIVNAYFYKNMSILKLIIELLAFQSILLTICMFLVFLFARDKIIKGNLKLILSVIKRFSYKKENNDDLFQVGTIGLMKAIDNFDLSHNVKFSTYAVPMIIGEIRRYIRDSGSIRVSRSYKDLAYKSLNFKESYFQKNGREPKIEEIASSLEVEGIDVILALESIQDTVSMSTPIYDNGSDVIELSDQLGYDEKLLDRIVEKKMLRQAYNRLDERQKTIIYKRYFLDETQMEIASDLDISQAQVSRLEKSALKEMYDYMKRE